MIICGDDVSVGRTAGSLVGRRGLAGQIGVLKVMGGAAGSGASFDDVYDLGVAFSQQVVSIAATLDHCHVPGRTEHGMLGDDEVEIGTGPHNEPGYKKLKPAPSSEQLVNILLAHCLDENDKERGYVHFEPGDEVVLLISNFGGMSQLEMGALTDEVLQQLDNTWHIEPVRVFVGPLETSLNAPALSISLINITTAAKNCSYSTAQIKSFMDVRTTTYWESTAGSQAHPGPRRKRLDQLALMIPPDFKNEINAAHDLHVDPVLLDKMLYKACQDLITAEPDLTKWDTVMGDGDCGETLKTGATALLIALDNKHQNLAVSGSVLTVLHEVEDIVESKMGGTLGGILGILFVSLRANLEAIVSKNPPSSASEHTAIWAQALTSALEQLKKYTPAQVGDRTVMDALIPFAQGLSSSAASSAGEGGSGSGTFEAGVEAARRGAEATRTMKPRLGRATYTAAAQEGAGGRDMPPDPGAWGAYVVIRGLKDGM